MICIPLRICSGLCTYAMYHSYINWAVSILLETVFWLSWRQTESRLVVRWMQEVYFQCQNKTGIPVKNWDMRCLNNWLYIEVVPINQQVWDVILPGYRGLFLISIFCSHASADWLAFLMNQQTEGQTLAFETLPQLVWCCDEVQHCQVWTKIIHK